MHTLWATLFLPSFISRLVTWVTTGSYRYFKLASEGIGRLGSPNLWSRDTGSKAVPPAAIFSSCPKASKFAKDVDSASVLLPISSLITSGAFSLLSSSRLIIYHSLVWKVFQANHPNGTQTQTASSCTYFLHRRALINLGRSLSSHLAYICRLFVHISEGVLFRPSWWLGVFLICEAPARCNLNYPRLGCHMPRSYRERPACTGEDQSWRHIWY